MFHATISHNVNFSVHYEPTMGEPKTPTHPGVPVEARILGITLCGVALTAPQVQGFITSYGEAKLQSDLLDHADSMEFRVAS